MKKYVKSLVVFSGIPAIVFILMTASAMHHLTSEQELGKVLYFDQTLSMNQNQACATCHAPESGFADPVNALDPAGRPVSEGSIQGKFGGRSAPSAAYAAFSPFFQWNADEEMYIGGQFWDGRANSLADQAGGPFLNPVEMAMPHLPQKTAVVKRLSENPDYIKMFKEVYNIDLSVLDFSKAKAQADADMDAPGVLSVYELMTEAIGAFEKSSEVNQFDSKFDHFRAGHVQLTAEEWKGLRLFEGKALCSECHITEPLAAPDGSEIPPLLTDFTYDNLGLPVNPKIAELIGEEQPTDYGLGGREDIVALDPDGLQLGKFKVPTLRNIALTAPYGHNGLFSTLEQIVHFYNTRDVLDVCETSDDDDGDDIGESCWPAPEVQQNVNVDELGDLELTEDEEAAIVAFMKTLSDGWGKANGMEPLPQPVMPPLPK